MSEQLNAKVSQSTVENNDIVSKPRLKVVKDEVDIESILSEKKINLPKNWGMSNGTANWNMKSKAQTLVKRLHKSEKLSEKITALEQYKDSFEWFLDSKVGSQEEVNKQVIVKISSFMKEVAGKYGVTEATLDNLMDHFSKTK
jgi:hypothetical protein